MVGNIIPNWPAYLQAFRHKFEMTQSQLAARLLLKSKRGLEEWEQGIKSPPPYLLLALKSIEDELVECFGVSRLKLYDDILSLKQIRTIGKIAAVCEAILLMQRKRFKQPAPYSAPMAYIYPLCKNLANGHWTSTWLGEYFNIIECISFPAFLTPAQTKVAHVAFITERQKIVDFLASK